MTVRTKTHLNLLWHFVRLTRPLFLVGGILLYLLGAVMAFNDGAPVSLMRLISGQVLVTSIQLMTHYTNEYYDMDSDRLNRNRTWFSGGSGVLVEGIFSPEVAWKAAVFVSALALIALILAGSQAPAVLLPGLIALILAWSYSGPPLWLARTGLGELFASLVVAFLVPIVGYMLQSGGAPDRKVLVVTVPLILIHFAMLIVFQIPDVDADREAGKCTLTARIGIRKAVTIHNLVLVLAFVILAGLFVSQWPGAQWMLLALPLAAWQVYTVQYYLKDANGRHLGLTMRAIGLFALTSLLWFAGFLQEWL